MLDEYFRSRAATACAARCVATSSPSMDISKASNFERYVFDARRRRRGVRRAVAELDAEGEFTAARRATSFASGRSTHADRLATIRRVFSQVRRGDRSAHRRRREGRPRARARRRAADLPGDRAAGEVRRDHPRGARPRAGAAGAASRTSRSLPQRFTVIERDVAALQALHRAAMAEAGEERPRRRAARLQLRAAHRLFPRRLLRHARPGRRRAPGVRAGDRSTSWSSASRKGNDLVTPRPELRFRGLKHGDRWCLHVLRWVEAWEAGKAPLRDPGGDARERAAVRAALRAQALRAGPELTDVQAHRPHRASDRLCRARGGVLQGVLGFRERERDARAERPPVRSISSISISAARRSKSCAIPKRRSRSRRDAASSASAGNASPSRWRTWTRRSRRSTPRAWRRPGDR